MCLSSPTKTAGNLGGDASETNSPPAIIHNHVTVKINKLPKVPAVYAPVSLICILVSCCFYLFPLNSQSKSSCARLKVHVISSITSRE